MDIREETERDRQGVFEVVIATFGGTDEAKLIETLDNNGLVITSLVAVEYGEIVAHILFSELEIASNDGESTYRAAALYPLSVAPTHQGMGIGSELVRQGIDICHKNDLDAIITFGQENYFSRFGFSTHNTENTKSAFSSQVLSILSLKSVNFDDFSENITFPPT